MRYIIYVVISLILIIGVYRFIYSGRGCHKPRGCMRGMSLTISTVTYGDFVEYIPQKAIYDTTKNDGQITMEIDELYLDRIEPGAVATTSFHNEDYSLIVTRIDSIIQNGRFTVEAKFQDKEPELKHNESIRLRIKLNKVYQTLLLPLGGFYRDTGGGQWILVLLSDGTIVKRSIKLGKKNTEHFVVLEGLKEGDRVITSPYENFIDDEEVDFDAVKDEIDKKLVSKGSSRRDAFGMGSWVK